MAAAARHRQLPAGGAFSGSGAQFVADFDQSYQAIEPAFTAASASSYVVRGGETLQSIALTVRGDAGLWYLIADANNLTGTETLAAGQALSIPNKVHSLHNTNDTFKPYDPNDAIGQTSATDPNQPAPKGKNNKCGVLGQILVIAVAVVVSHFAGPWVGKAVYAVLGSSVLATAVTTAATAAVASAASQGVGIALGVQDRFSWKQVGMAALQAGLSGGSSPVNSVKSFAIETARAAVRNVVYQGLGVALGLQDRFDWTGVAVAGVTSSVSSLVGGKLDSRYSVPATVTSPQTAGLGVGLAAGAAGAVAGAAVRSLIDGSDFGDNVMTSLPGVIGNTIGNAIAGQVASRASSPRPLYADDVPRGQLAGLGDAGLADAVNEVSEIVVTGRRTGPQGFFSDLLHGRFNYLGTDLSNDWHSFTRAFAGGNAGVDGTYSNYLYYQPPTGSEMRQLRQEQQRVSDVGQQIMAHDPLMKGLVVGTLAPVAVPFLLAEGVPTALAVAGRSLVTKQAAIKYGIGGSTGALVSGGFSIANGNSPQKVLLDSGKGFVSGIATSAGGLAGKTISRGGQAAGEAAAAFAVTKATGGNNFEASLAGATSAAFGFWTGSPAASVAGGVLGRNIAASLEKPAIDIAISIEKKLMGTEFKHLVSPYLPGNGDKN